MNKKKNVGTTTGKAGTGTTVSENDEIAKKIG